MSNVSIIASFNYNEVRNVGTTLSLYICGHLGGNLRGKSWGNNAYHYQMKMCGV